MSKIATLSGSLTVNGDTCVTSSSSQTVRELSLGQGCNAGSYYEASVSSSVVIAGSDPVDLDCLDALTSIELLYIKSSAPVTVRINAIAAIAVGVGGTYPTGFGGGETLITTIDGTVVTTTFDVADQTLVQVINRVNSSMALAGIATPRADSSGGQLRITGVETAVDGTEGILSFAGTGAATLGYTTPTTTDALGKDVPLYGAGLFEFERAPNAPTKVQAYGDATIDIVAAGRST